MKACPKCLRSTYDFENYCPKDGQQLNPLPQCVKCGTVLYPTQEYCTHCGLKKGELIA